MFDIGTGRLGGLVDGTLAKSQGHGHVVPRPDGARARCGGPGICGVCRDEARELADRSPVPSAPSMPIGWVCPSCRQSNSPAERQCPACTYKHRSEA